jgi:hypothetical protein
VPAELALRRMWGINSRIGEGSGHPKFYMLRIAKTRRRLRLSLPVTFSVTSLFSVGCADALSRDAEVGVYLSSGGSVADASDDSAFAQSPGSGGRGSGGVAATSTGGTTSVMGSGGTHSKPPPSTNPTGNHEDAGTSPPPVTTADASDSNPPLGPGCSPGAYGGAVTCTIASPGTAGGPPPAPTTVTGTMKFTLARSPTSLFAMTVSSGSVTAQGTGFSYSAGMVGELDCITGTFHAAVGDPPTSSPPTATTQSGNLDGQVDRPTLSFAGGFWIARGTTPCIGTWSAQPVP